MRYRFRFGFALALGLALMAGCSDENGEGGSGGTGGSGGSDSCAGVICEDTECKIDGACNPSDGVCDYTLVEDGTACSEGECLDGVCAPIGAFPCTEQGIRDAIAEGGGPHFFACDGPTTVVTEAEIVIGNDVILDGGLNLTLDGDRNHRVLIVPLDVTVELRGFVVTGGARGGLTDLGVGIANLGTLTVADSLISGNSGGSGAGVYVAASGTLILINSTVSDNASRPEGGGIFIQGGGRAVVTNSTLSGNSAGNGSAVGADGFMGGTGPASLTMIHSTVAGNAASQGADLAGGALEATLINTLIDGDCNIFVGPPISLGHNIESPGDTCGFDQATDQVNVTAEQLNLGPLQNNGGATHTHALLPGSVAIDQIPAVDCVDADGAPLTTDQRGEPRPGGDACDVGAFELQP